MKILMTGFIICVLTGTMACSTYMYALYVPMGAYQMAQGVRVGTPALPYYAYSGTPLAVFNDELKKAGAKVNLEDTYIAAYGKPFSQASADGDTGQSFSDMETATGYLQKILRAKGVRDADNFFLTTIDSAVDSGFTLVAAVYRPEKRIAVVDKFGASREMLLTCDSRPYYRPYRIDCDGGPLDIVYDWAAVPNDCFVRQGHQAIFFTLLANKLLERKARIDYWDAESKWIAGDYESVVTTQDQMVCMALDIEEGYTQQKKGI